MYILFISKDDRNISNLISEKHNITFHKSLFCGICSSVDNNTSDFDLIIIAMDIIGIDKDLTKLFNIPIIGLTDKHYDIKPNTNMWILDKRTLDKATINIVIDRITNEENNNEH